MKNLIQSKISTYVLLGCILAIAFFIRIYMIGVVPPSPDWDEAALGYNAYSILLTGKDEYGKFLPVVLRSFDDYKPALYAYLIIPFIKIFGLSVIAVRLPSVLFGVIGIAVVFFIVRELFPSRLLFAKVSIPSQVIALATTLLVAISPWHIQFSRVGFEANVGLTFNLLVVLFFLKGLKRKPFLILSAICAALNFYVYQSEKVYTPLLVLILSAIYWKKLFTSPRKWLVISAIVGILVSIPMAFYIVTNPNALSRAKGVSVFADTTKLLSVNSAKLERDAQNHDIVGQIIDNRRIDYIKAFTSGYLAHFQPNWLFYEGDIARHHAPFMGLLYLFTLPFILLGFYVLLFSNISRSTKLFIVLFMLIAPIPASITIDVPHAVRTINFIPSFDLLSALGLLVFTGYILQKRSYIKIPVLFILSVIIFLNISYYFDQYFVQQNYYDSMYWQYGWQDAVSETVKEAKNFDNVVISNQPPLDQSYIFYLFYLKYDPALYQKQGGTKSGGFNKEHTAFDKYIFRPIDWQQDALMKNTLFVGSSQELKVNLGYTVNYLDGTPAILFSKRFQ